MTYCVGLCSRGLQVITSVFLLAVTVAIFTWSWRTVEATGLGIGYFGRICPGYRLSIRNPGWDANMCSLVFKVVCARLGGS